jgi:ABC-type Fe3+-hydroxamate transport system substrate-binding protein
VGASENGSFSVERVLSLRPDLLVVLAYDYNAMTPMMTQIEQAGIPILVVDYNAQVLAKHVAGTLALGQATGNLDRAREVADLYTARVADIAQRVQGADRPKVYVELGQGGAQVVGNTYNNAMWGRMVELAGGTNIATGRIPTGFSPMSPEWVLAAAPEHVIITASSWAGSPNAVQAGYDVDIATTRRTLAPYAERAGWSGLPAIRNGELHAVETGLARSLWDWTATHYIAKQIHPALFSDVDPVSDLRRYHERFLPVAFEGTWMARLTPSAS